ncbi:MAG: hypothetical protein DMG70_13935 [Acidobacteria bacterium]|nr:MAG: hypothetical protein DMG70_13935 [Acidobacteriota bacterium]
MDLVRAVRRRFGNISLMVDANTSYQLDDTGIFEELDRFHLMMIEQPLEREALTEHAELQRRLHTSICLDESAHDLESVGSMYSAGQRAYPQHQGAAHWRRLAGAPGARPGASCRHFLLARDYAGVGIASVQGLHLATLPNFTLPSDVVASERWFVDDIVGPPISITETGFICLPDGAGMGYRVAADKVVQYRTRFEELRA